MLRGKSYLHVGAALLCLFAGRAAAQTDFTTFVAIGDSLAAGFSNGCMLEKHQAHSVPALIARQAGVTDFQQPVVSEPGIPAEMVLLQIAPTVVIGRKSSDHGTPTNLALPRPYNNLAVPGHTAYDALVTTGGGRFAPIILRDGGSQAVQAAALHPTLIGVWIGDSDVSGAALEGRVVEGGNITPVDEFRQTYGDLIAALKATGADIIAANIGDPTTIPAVNTIKPYVVNPATGEPVLVNGERVPLLGIDGPLTSDSFVTLAASPLLAEGIGIPRELGGTGQPLPGGVVLDPGEVANIRGHLDSDNQAIADICGQAGIPVVDLHALYARVASPGVEVGGIRVSSDFLTGGFYGYDGLHPTDLGYALMANEWIAVLNAHGANLPLVDLSPILAGQSQATVAPHGNVVVAPEAWSVLVEHR
jgi:lysophospholipase L1-like esterase